jgi:hypothetical protein
MFHTIVMKVPILHREPSLFSQSAVPVAPSAATASSSV